MLHGRIKEIQNKRAAGYQSVEKAAGWYTVDPNSREGLGMNNLKTIIGLLLVVLIAIGISGCGSDNTNAKKGEPDRTGSWGQINQVIERDKNWKQIVSKSAFQLGERSVKGSWNVPNGKQDYYEVKYGTYPCLDGSTVSVPMAVEFTRQHLGLSDEDAQSFVLFNTTHNAYVNLISFLPNYGGMIRSTTTFLEENHPVDLIIATEPSDEELQLAKDNQVELIVRPVCYDAFVFITHKDNPVDSLTVEQIQKIYSGKITNWQEVGGDDADIIPYQREANSGSQTAMEKLVMKGIPMLTPASVEVEAGMGELIEAVAEYDNSKSSLGYTYQFYIDKLYKNDNIKVLRVNDVSSEPENLRNEAYPFTTRYYGVIRGGDEQNTGGLFLDWMLSAEGQACIQQAGYVPLK